MTSEATTAPGSTPAAGLRRWLTGCVTGMFALASLSVMALPATADELDDRRTSLEGQISRSNSQLAGYQSRLDQAAANLSSSRAQLADAQAALAKAESERQHAAAEEAKRADELSQANTELADGKQRVAEGQRQVELQKKKAASDLRTAHQQNTGLMSIGMLFGETSDLGDVSSRIQWAQTLYNANSAEMNRLTSMQFDLQNEQTKLADLEDKARVAREAAAEQLAARQAAEQAAADAQAAVSSLVAANQRAESDAKNAVEQERARNAEMQAEMDSVTARIQQRNAEREAAERRAAEEARRAAEAAAAAAAAEREAANQAPAYTPPAPQGNGFPLATPAYGPYTSPFGWRTNPVLGYSELHDGLDIGAGCGTPLYAAASGTVVEVGYAGGWGWRAVIDHGYVGGVALSTGYNHAQGYIVSPGQWVERGQVIGYVGTTGLSTGCHLHFHTWVNGAVSDPAPYL